MIRSYTVRQTVSYIPVADELKKQLDSIQCELGYKVISVTETKIGTNEQGFIILYDTKESEDDSSALPVHSLINALLESIKKEFSPIVGEYMTQEIWEIIDKHKIGGLAQSGAIYEGLKFRFKEGGSA